jgi:cyclopropane fatty-acyl-phospholipid synthase-like methyltransferase
LFGSKNDIKFYEELALQSGSQALELGVGTARVAIALAKAGITVVGIDNSIYMLKVAKNKLAEESEIIRRRVILKRGDMRNFNLKRLFPFIYIPASTFDHNISVEDQKRTLASIHKHLETEGIFAFDLEQTTADKPQKSWWIDRKDIKNGKMIVRSVFTRRDQKTCRCSLDIFYDVYKDGRMLERYHEYGEVAIISKEKVTALLEHAGFKIDAVYGDFDKSKCKGNSPRIAIVTRKR